MDNRDEIIRTQMEVIETLVSNNLRRVADDFWGSSDTKKQPERISPRPRTQPQKRLKTKTRPQRRRSRKQNRRSRCP